MHVVDLGVCAAVAENNAVRDANKIGKVSIIAFDEEDETLAGVKDGAIYATVVQQPYEFGYQSVKLMEKVLAGDKQVAEVPLVALEAVGDAGVLGKLSDLHLTAPEKGGEPVCGLDLGLESSPRGRFIGFAWSKEQTLPTHPGDLPMNRPTALACLVLTAGSLLATTACAQQPTRLTPPAHSAASMEMHQAMNQGSSISMPMTGDPDTDFATMMTMHHRQASAMIDVYRRSCGPSGAGGAHEGAAAEGNRRNGAAHKVACQGPRRQSPAGRGA